MNLSTNTTVNNLGDLSLLHYLRVLVLPSFILPWIIFNFLLLLTICFGKKIPIIIRLILSNIMVASEVMLVGLAVAYMDDVLIFSIYRSSCSFFTVV